MEAFNSFYFGDFHFIFNFRRFPVFKWNRWLSEQAYDQLRWKITTRDKTYHHPIGFLSSYSQINVENQLTWVSKPSGSLTIKECALATLAASSISIWSASGLPKSIFSLMVVANRAGSWLTSPICCLNHLSFNALMSCPSSRTCPE